MFASVYRMKHGCEIFPQVSGSKCSGREMWLVSWFKLISPVTKPTMASSSMTRYNHFNQYWVRIGRDERERIIFFVPVTLKH
jgi:hypothetical protein